jgi:O-antigen biosynthesis protein WbqV
MRPDVDVGIEFTGLRPGEKLYEELFDETEDRLDGGVEGILVALSKSINLEVLRRLFDELAGAAAQPDRAALLRLLAHAVPSYHNPHAPPQDAAGEPPARDPIRALWGYSSNPRYVAEQP